MHELLLFGQIPASRHDQVLNILAGIAAMQPVPVLEKHLVFKPNRLPASTRPKQVGAAQDIQKAQMQALQAQTQGDLFYMQMVVDVSGAGGRDGEQSDSVVGAGEETVIQVRDLSYGGKCRSNGFQQKTSNAECRSQETASVETPTTAGIWTLQFRDLPEVARQRPVTSRLVADVPITSGDHMQFMNALEYSYVSHLS